MKRCHSSAPQPRAPHILLLEFKFICHWLWCERKWQPETWQTLFFFSASKHLKPQTPDRSYSPHISGPRIHARAPAVDGWGAGKKLISSSIRRDAENTILSSGLSVEESDKFCLTFNRHKDERGVVSSGETHSTAAGMGCPCRQRCTYPEATCGWRRQKCVAHCLCGRLLELCIMQHRATKIM